MAYPTSPSVSIYGTNDTVKIPLIKSESEGAYTRVRRRTTRSKSSFTLKYDSITHAEFDILSAYFNTNQGLSFDFTHPSTNTTYTCIFSQEELRKDYSSHNRVTTEVQLEEV